ncbi:MAG: lysophospholipase [Cyanobacteria bacterium]|nr:lysophospholipase [Cyanobacteriota bacterium]
MQPSNEIKLILFSQHGMTDTNQDMKALAHKVAPPQTQVVAPNLGFFQTCFAIEPLIRKLEITATKNLKTHPNIPIRIIATSLGGVLWVELLSRYPEWLTRCESLILLGSPLGGADLARIIDPFGWGIGMAKHLGKNRRLLAEAIAATVPTLVVAGNTDGGGDGTITVESTKLKYAHFTCLNGVSHPKLKTHPTVVKTIQEFWSKPRDVLPAPEESLISKLIELFRYTPGMTDANAKDFNKAEIAFRFKDGTTIRTWKNPLGVHHVFIANVYEQCEYSGFVGWVHSNDLKHAIKTAIQFF